MQISNIYSKPVCFKANRITQVSKPVSRLALSRDTASFGYTGGGASPLSLDEQEVLYNEEHSKADVERKLAILKQLAAKNNPGDASHISKCLKSSKDVKVISKAISALASISKKGDRNNINLILPYIKSVHERKIKATALWALSVIAEKGDEEVMKEVSESLHDENYQIRKQAIEVIEKLAIYKEHAEYLTPLRTTEKRSDVSNMLGEVYKRLCFLPAKPAG